MTTQEPAASSNHTGSLGCARLVGTLFGGLLGALVAVLSQGIRGRWGQVSWKPSRYWNAGGYPVLAIVDPLVALVLGAVVGARLAWLLQDLVARARGKPVKSRLFHAADVLLLIPVLWLSYLTYVINFAD
jgi:hypothetical protein